MARGSSGLEGKTALITGAARGIGAESALRLAETAERGSAAFAPVGAGGEAVREAEDQ
jgi:NAD(P)-dependent dehydrogenase (short-subunit alcohol dehydrogenase family)